MNDYNKEVAETASCLPQSNSLYHQHNKILLCCQLQALIHDVSLHINTFLFDSK